MVTRRTKLKPNKNGRFRREIGYTDQHKKKQARFDLGTDEKEAEKRVARLLELYEDCQRVSELPMWTAFGLYAGKLIAKGTYQIPYEPDWEQLGSLESAEEKCATYVQMLRLEQNRHPSLHIVPSNEEMYAGGVEINQAIEKHILDRLAVGLKEDGVIITNQAYGDRLVTGSLHEALDAYAGHVEKTGIRIDETTLKYSQRKRLKYVKVLKQQHPDKPLMSMCSFDAIAEMFSHWANRPEYAPGQHYNKTSAHHRLKELQRFLRWLDHTSEFEWEMPRGVEQLQITFVGRPEDRSGTALKRKLYTPEQLGIIAKYANNFDRLLLFTGVNCAFGAAEVGRLLVGDVLFQYRHEYADRLHFETTRQDSFIRMIREKTDQFGEWLLWPETTEILRWGIQRAQSLGSEIVVCRSSGAMLYKEENQNASAAFAKRWRSLLKRVRKKHPELPFYSFGKLRKILPDILRHKYSDALASIALSHKTAYKPDSLLEAYGNKPFGRLHTAIRELRDHFQPMLDVASSAPLSGDGSDRVRGVF